MRHAEYWLAAIGLVLLGVLAVRALPNEWPAPEAAIVPQPKLEAKVPTRVDNSSSPAAVVPAPKITHISGQVVTADGAPVVGAQIEASVNGGRIVTTRSTANGAFTLRPIRRAEQVYFRVSARGFVNTPAEPPGGIVMLDGESSEQVVQLVLETRSTVSGVVVNSSGAPVERHLLTAHRAGDQPDQGFRPSGIDADGSFTFYSLEAGEYVLGFYTYAGRWYDAAPSGAQGFTLGRSESLHGLRVVAPPAVMEQYVSGTVFDPNGDPAADVVIHDSEKQRIARTDAVGNFTGIIDSFPAKIFARRAGFSDSEPQALDTGQEGLRLVLRPPAILSGRVVYASTGRPIKTFRVGQTQFETSDGRFEGVPYSVGTDRIFVSVHGHPIAETRIPPLGVAERRHVEVRVASGTQFEGRVLDAAGGPVRLAHVRIANYSGPRETGHADATSYDGGFLLGPLLDGQVELVVSPQDQSPETFSVMVSPTMPEVILRLAPHYTLRIEVTGVAAKDEKHVGVVLFDDKTTPPPFSQVLYKNPENGIVGIHALKNGAALFPKLKSGTYTAVVAAGHFVNGKSFTGSAISNHVVTITKNARETTTIHVTL